MTLNDGATVGYCQLSWLFVCRCYQYLVNKDVYYCWLKHHCRSRMQKPIQLRKLLIAQPVSRWATVTAPRSVPGRLPAYELCLRRRSYIQSTWQTMHAGCYVSTGSSQFYSYFYSRFRYTGNSAHTVRMTSPCDVTPSWRTNRKSHGPEMSSQDGGYFRRLLRR